MPGRKQKKTDESEKNKMRQFGLEKEKTKQGR
jgi:hypothetical protein